MGYSADDEKYPVFTVGFTSEELKAVIENLLELEVFNRLNASFITKNFIKSYQFPANTVDQFPRHTSSQSPSV